MNRAYIGIGSNMGNRISYIKKAIAIVEKQAGSVFAKSYVYETEPWGFVANKKFLNMVIGIKSSLNPNELLSVLLSIENFLGRVHTNNKYDSRPIDLDILVYSDRVVDEPDLRIPHPLLQDRLFVLVPLLDIYPDMIHPVSKKSIKELLDNCSDRGYIYRSPLSAKL